MGIKIDDGSGSGRLAKVNDKRRLAVSSSSFSESSLVAFSEGGTFNWTSTYSATSGDEVIYVKNTSTTKVMVIDKIAVSSVNAGFFELYQVSGTASGTTITGKNTNLTSGNVAAATALGNASVTGLTIGDKIDHARVPASSRATMELRDVLILGQSDAIAVTYTGSTGIADVTITGYYDTLEGV